jgi:hypothetical protein
MYTIKANQELISQYKVFKDKGLAAIELYELMLNEGNKNYDGILVIMALYKLSLEEARKVVYEYHLKKKSEK